jgi:diguanylate cyclase (GGDEF)-like protein
MRPSLSRHNRYLAAIGGLAVLAILLVGLAYGATDSERADIDEDAVRATELRDLASDLADTIRDQEAAVHDYLLSHEDASMELYDSALLAEADFAAKFRAAASEAPGVLKAIDELVAFAVEWRASFAEPAIAAVKGGGDGALDRFTSTASDDHEAIDAALEPMGLQLDDLDVALRARASNLATTRTAATGFGLAVMVLAASLALWLIRRYGRALEREAMNAGVLNRFTEVTSFASDDTAIAASNLEALALLVRPDASVTHVLNRSKDRAVPEAITGNAIADVVPLGSLAHCAGLVRGSMYVVDDAGAALSVRCPVYPVDHGTLACVPLASGETVGAVHLYWERPNALPLELRSSVVRIAEHAALGIGNRRLLAALHGQANTDARTGLANSRAFDRALEEALTQRTTDEAISVLMLDLDHFKDFNDRFGHPAGDEALRAFANVLRACMRERDTAARYGGEEFAVLLPDVDAFTARTIAERIRSETEAAVIVLGPGQTARITVSIGVSTAPAQGNDRITLLRVADEALYLAKDGGRNRVESTHDDTDGASGRKAMRDIAKSA